MSRYLKPSVFAVDIATTGNVDPWGPMVGKLSSVITFSFRIFFRTPILCLYYYYSRHGLNVVIEQILLGKTQMETTLNLTMRMRMTAQTYYIQTLRVQDIF